MSILFFGDSMFKPSFIPPDIKTFVEFKLGKSVEFQGLSGKTSVELIGEQGSIHSFLKGKNFEIIFLSIGQNDISKYDLTEFHPDVAAQAIGESICEKIGMLGCYYPSIKFVILPLTLRNLSQHFNPHWPQNHDPICVNRSNSILKKLYTYFIPQTSNILFVNPAFLHHAHDQFMFTIADGLHLNEVGKKVVVHEAIRQFLSQ